MNYGSNVCTLHIISDHLLLDLKKKGLWLILAEQEVFVNTIKVKRLYLRSMTIFGGSAYSGLYSGSYEQSYLHNDTLSASLVTVRGICNHFKG